MLHIAIDDRQVQVTQEQEDLHAFSISLLQLAHYGMASSG